jgi:hypothetical protein
VQGQNGAVPTRQYHVQFFGKVQRAWVKEQAVISYEGLEAFNEAGRQLKMATATRKIKQKEKHLNAYFPTGNTRITWQSAVDGKVSFINLSATSGAR